jgi:hypothetical protein
VDKSNLFAMKKILWILVAAMLFSLAFMSPQERVITGKVTAADGSAIPGVNVF